MKTEYNSQAFTPDDIKAGKMKQLMKYLLTFNETSESSYFDIHIWSDGFCQCVDWIERHHSSEYGDGEFRFVDNGEHIVKEIIFPDNSIQYVELDVDENQAIKEWAEENGWVQGVFGRYYDPKTIKEI